MNFVPADQLTLDFLRRHGPLHTPYLYEATKELRSDRTGHRKSLLRLARNNYLRLPAPLNNPLIHTDYLVYDTVESKDHRDFIHAFMTSIITANIELEALKAGYKFISQAEILQGRDLAFPTDDKPTYPDALFGIDYGNGVRFFALETDRGTEAINPKHQRANSIKRKLQAYNHILNKKTHEDLNLPTIFPVFVTTNPTRMKSFVTLAEILFKSSKRMLFNSIEGFQPYHRTPKLIPSLFGEFQRAGNDPLDISKS